MPGQQIPSDIDSLGSYMRLHGLPAEAPDAPWLRHATRLYGTCPTVQQMRAPGGMSGTILPMPHEAKAHMLLSAARMLKALIAEMADATMGAECHAYDEAHVHAEHVVDQLGAAVRARDEAVQPAAAE